MELMTENQTLRDTALKQSEQRISMDYCKIKDMVLDLLAQNTRNYLVVSGILEQVGEDSDKTQKSFIPDLKSPMKQSTKSSSAASNVWL